MRKRKRHCGGSGGGPVGGHVDSECARARDRGGRHALHREREQHQGAGDRGDWEGGSEPTAHRSRRACTMTFRSTMPRVATSGWMERSPTGSRTAPRPGKLTSGASSRKRWACGLGSRRSSRRKWRRGVTRARRTCASSLRREITRWIALRRSVGSSGPRLVSASVRRCFSAMRTLTTETWVSPTSGGGGIDLATVAAHEFRHSLGLGHCGALN